MTGDADSNGRDGAGRFAAGNAFGRGNPALRHLAGLQAAVRSAITPADLVQVLQGMRDAAAGGDPAAARVLFERCLGRAREEPPEAPGIELGDLATASGCASATAAIAAAAAAGTVEPDVATTLATLVGKAAELGALAELERRITALEGNAR